MTMNTTGTRTSAWIISQRSDRAACASSTASTGSHRMGRHRGTDLLGLPRTHERGARRGLVVRQMLTSGNPFKLIVDHDALRALRRAIQTESSQQGGTMKLKRILAAAVLALTTAAGTGAVVATTAPPASADVLVNYDGGSISLGCHLILGVWYQQFSGGPTGYWAGVWSYPANRWIFIRSGHATTNWTSRAVKPSQRGKYATVYNADGVRLVFYTTVK